MELAGIFESSKYIVVVESHTSVPGLIWTKGLKIISRVKIIQKSRLSLTDNFGLKFS